MLRLTAFVRLAVCASVSLTTCYVGAVEITRVEPGLVSTLGGTAVTVHGSDLTRLHVIEIGGRRLLNPTFDEATGTSQGITQALAAGFHDAEALSAPGGSVEATLLQAVEAAPPATLLAVEPSLVCADGGTVVTVRGANLRSETRISFGIRDLINPIANQDGSAITGEAPALGMTEPEGERDVSAEDSRGRATLARGVTYASDCDAYPGPQEVEGTLAADAFPGQALLGLVPATRTARFQWVNPIPYSEILVLDSMDQIVDRLPGDATFFEMAAGGTKEVDIKLRGVVDALKFAEDVLAAALAVDCERPPPLPWGGVPGELNFTVRGNHLPPAVTRSTPAAGAGADDQGSGGGSTDLHAYNGFPQDAGTTGYLAKQIDVDKLIAPHLVVDEGNKLVTGFVLDQDADKLEIAAHYEKLATAFGLSLCGRLIHVFPDDGFVDEFTFPDVLLNQGKELNCITYFRADKDVGIPGNPNDGDPTNDPAVSCQLPIPAGEYLFELYAKGGSSKLPYYNFADDPRDNELLIAGAPCFPYPLVRITDLTGLQTLPDVLDIQATLPYRGPQAQCAGSEIRVKFTAYGLWTDEQNESFSIHPGDAGSDPSYKANFRFEYRWTIHDRPNPTVKITSGNSLSHCLADWGCYKVELEVVDKACAFKKTRAFEVPVLPNNVTCSTEALTFLFPTPDPGGIYAITGLNAPSAPPPPSQGFFEGTRPVSFRTLVVPKCHCDNPADCPSPLLSEVEFRLAVFGLGGFTKIDNVNFIVEDLCPNVTEGPKYFAVTIEDLGQIPVSEALAQLEFKSVFFQGRKPQANPDLGWTNVGFGNAKPIKLTNRPKSIENGFWNGCFVDGDRSYHFLTKSSENTEEEIDVDPSNAIDLGLPGVDVGIPSYDNELSQGFTSRFMMHNGVWSPETGSGTASGKVLSNEMDGAPVQVTPMEVGGSGAGGGGGSFPHYEWCDHQKIMEQHFHQTLFESILYSGFVGPLPVTVWASIGFGLDILVESYATVFVAPFAPLEGGAFAETHFYLLSSVDVAIPCQISADIVGGLVSIAVRLLPSAEFFLDTHVWSVDAQPHADLFTKAELDLSMEVEGCVDLLLAEVCASETIPILENAPLITEVGTSPRPPITCDGGAGAGAAFGNLPPAAEEETAGTAAGTAFVLPYQSISAPVVIYSPDLMSFMKVFFDQDGKSIVTVNNQGLALPPGADLVGKVLNPAATFVSNTAGLIAWTDQYCSESGLGSLCTPNADPPPPAPTPAERNLMLAQQELVVSPVILTVQAPFPDPRWYIFPHFRVSDPPSEVPDPTQRRPDGMAALAADLASLSDSPPGGEALVAWVAYTGDYLITDGMRTIYQRLDPPIPCPSGDPQQPFKLCRFETIEVENIRPQMEATAIFVRRVSLNGLIAGESKLAISDPGINIEPSIAVSPSGQVGYCVWVHDPAHTNLIDSNLGRFLKYALYSKATNSWGPPLDVIPNPDDYPGILEPYVALKDDLNGLVAFTAVEAGAPLRDTGLGGSRFVYGVRLENGVFGEPFLIHGKCLRRVYGWHPVVHFPTTPDTFDPMSLLKIPHPEWVMTFQGTGPIGLREGSGNVMVLAQGAGMTQPVAPICLTDDQNVHSNVASGLAGGLLSTLNLNSGSAFSAPGSGGGVSRSFETVETRLEPDLAVAACRLTDSFPAPGSSVRVTVEIENRGLAGSPLDNAGTSAVGLELLFLGDEGEERVVERVPLPMLVPGESTVIERTIEMPHEPVRLRAALAPNPIDRDPTNDSRECFFGAPAPLEFFCEPITIADEEVRQAVSLTWMNPAIYDAIFLYRDGAMLTSVPGGCTRFVDLYPSGGVALYEIRGCMGASKSSRVACAPPGGLQQSGDCNQDGARDISDPICLLGHLFQNAPPVLPCAGGTKNDPGNRDLLDVNGDGDVDLSDAVYLLAFLFSGGPQPVLGTDCVAIEGCPSSAGCEP